MRNYEGFSFLVILYVVLFSLVSCQEGKVEYYLENEISVSTSTSTQKEPDFCGAYHELTYTYEIHDEDYDLTISVGNLTDGVDYSLRVYQLNKWGIPVFNESQDLGSDPVTFESLYLPAGFNWELTINDDSCSQKVLEQEFEDVEWPEEGRPMWWFYTSDCDSFPEFNGGSGYFPEYPDCDAEICQDSPDTNQAIYWQSVEGVHHYEVLLTQFSPYWLAGFAHCHRFGTDQCTGVQHLLPQGEGADNILVFACADENCTCFVVTPGFTYCKLPYANDANNSILELACESPVTCEALMGVPDGLSENVFRNPHCNFVDDNSCEQIYQLETSCNE